LPFWAIPVWKEAASVGPQDGGETATLFIALKGQKSLKKMVSSWLDNTSQLRVGLADGYQADGVEEFVNGGLNLHRQLSEVSFPVDIFSFCEETAQNNLNQRNPM
jgi:hypothetical protein